MQRETAENDKDRLVTTTTPKFAVFLQCVCSWRLSNLFHGPPICSAYLDAIRGRCSLISAPRRRRFRLILGSIPKGWAPHLGILLLQGGHARSHSLILRNIQCCNTLSILDYPGAGPNGQQLRAEPRKSVWGLHRYRMRLCAVSPPGK